MESEIRTITEAQPVFSSREKEILHLVAAGKTSKEIANELFLCIDTVESHRKHMIKKLNAKNLFGVLAYCFCTGILNKDKIQSMMSF